MTPVSRRFAPYADAFAVRRRILERISTLRDNRNLSLLASLGLMRTEAAFNAFLDAPSYARLSNLVMIEVDMRRIPAALDRPAPAGDQSQVPGTLRRGLPATMAPPAGLRIVGQGRLQLDPYADWWSRLPKL